MAERPDGDSTKCASRCWDRAGEGQWTYCRGSAGHAEEQHTDGCMVWSGGLPEDEAPEGHVIAYVPPVDPDRSGAFFPTTRGGGRIPTWFRHQRQINGSWVQIEWVSGHAAEPKYSSVVRNFEQAVVLHDPEDKLAGMLGRLLVNELLLESTPRDRQFRGDVIGLIPPFLEDWARHAVETMGGRLLAIHPSTGRERGGAWTGKARPRTAPRESAEAAAWLDEGGR